MKLNSKNRNRIFTPSFPNAPQSVEANVTSPRVFGMQDVSDCANVNEVMEKLQIADYTKEDIPEVCKGYSRILDDRENPIAIVKQSYDLLQPVETFAFMDAMGGSLDIKYTSAGFTHGGRRMFIEAEYGEIDAGHERKKGDILKRKLTATGSFDGTLSTQINASFLRVWCSNGMANWIKDTANKISVRHTRNQRAIFAQAIEQATGIKQVFINLQKDIEVMKNTAFTESYMLEASKRFFNVGEDMNQESTRVINNIDTLMREFNNEDRGTFGASAYDAMNAFTAFTTHERSYRETKETSRDENRFRFINNETYTQKFRKIIDAVTA